MNERELIFISIYAILTLFGCTLFIWGKFQNWTKKEHLSVDLICGIFSIGSLLRLLNALIKSSITGHHAIVGITGVALQSVATGMAILLFIWIYKRKN